MSDLTIHHALEILQRQPYKSMLEAARDGQRILLFHPMRSGMTLYRKTVAAWQAVFHPETVRRPAMFRRRRIRSLARARKMRRGWR